MHNAAPRQRRHFWCMRQQAVDEGAAAMSGGGMHHQPRGLVQHDHMFIFMQDIQREGLGDPLDTVFGLRHQHQMIIDGDLIAGLGSALIPLQTPYLDPFGQPTARKISEQRCCHRIKALAMQGRRDPGRQRLFGR